MSEERCLFTEDCRCTSCLNEQVDLVGGDEAEDGDGFCPECGAPPDTDCDCPCDLCAESGLTHCICDDDDGPYPLPGPPGEDTDDLEHDFTDDDLVT